MSTTAQRTAPRPDTDTRDRGVAAAAMTTAAVLATAGFTALGSVFDYPDVLKEPTATILDLYRAHPTTVSTWFLVLAVGAALLAPTGLALGRLVGGRGGRWVAGVGVAAALVQVVGLSRWVLFVPGLSEAAQDARRADAAVRTFETLHTWLGEALGETVGYALTAAFTVLVVRGLAGLPRWVEWLGLAAAALVATGVLVPLGLEVAELTNFMGTSSGRCGSSSSPSSCGAAGGAPPDPPHGRPRVVPPPRDGTTHGSGHIRAAPSLTASRMRL